VTRVPLNDLSRTPVEVRDALSLSIRRVLDRGWYLKGPETESFEAVLSSRMADRPVVTVANGTDALYLALAAVGVGSGSRVATVANAGGYTTGAVLRLGAEPVFVDVEPATAQMSPAALEAVVGNNDVDAVVMTHLYGLVGEVARVTELCSAQGIPLIEDCAQSMGAVVNGVPAGAFGDIATTSFYPTKNLGGMGDGGAVICRDADLRRRVADLAQYGWSDRYLVSTPGGINSRLDEVQAVVLSQAERHLDRDNRIRRSIVSRYSRALAPGRHMIHVDDERFVAHLAILVTPTRDADVASLTEAGVTTGVHYPIPDHRQPGWSGLFRPETLPVTEQLAERIVTLPCFPQMTDDEIGLVIGALRDLR
jgi:dTDP-4-amino-4,6-dideoxygalactose transaminase